MIYERKSDIDAKTIVRKTLTQKIWTFKCFKLDLNFKSPYHIHLLMDFKKKISLTCMFKSYVNGLLFT